MIIPAHDYDCIYLIVTIVFQVIINATTARYVHKLNLYLIRWRRGRCYYGGHIVTQQLKLNLISFTWPMGGVNQNENGKLVHNTITIFYEYDHLIDRQPRKLFTSIIR